MEQNVTGSVRRIALELNEIELRAVTKEFRLHDILNVTMKSHALTSLEYRFGL